MAKETTKLFDMFPPVSTEEWMAKITADLKGADFAKKLVWRTNEGFNVQPFYRREDLKGLTALDSRPGEFPYLRGTRDNNDWLIRQEVLGENAEKMNQHALEITSKGVESIGIYLKGDLEAKDLETILKGIDLKKVEVNVNCCPGHAVEAAEVLVGLVEKAGARDDFRGSIDFNPFRRLLRKGMEFPKDITEISKRLYDVVKPVAGLRCFAVDSAMLCNCGAFITQELGYALAWGAEWLTLLTEAGIPACEVAKRIKFNMGVSSNYFMEIAKFRAGRMLWAEIVKAYGVDPSGCDCCKMKVHACTSRFNMTIYDAHVNLLRSMTESMSAALAGVDSIETLPFDLPYKCPDDFSERIARNQQVLLRDESHLDKVVDPAGGSYYIEVLTASIAKEAWKLFTEVEDNGGFLALLRKGEIQGKVNESGVKRHLDVARRKEILLGTNQYPNVNEMALDKIQNEGCACGCPCATGEVADGAVQYLNFDRAASQFEQLRLDTERSGRRPKVFMLTIGNLAMRLARAQFSGNFFGCAGYEIIDNLGFETVKEGVDAAFEKGADVIVLCSSDDEYAQLAPEAYRLIGDKAIFVVAGAPACMDELKAQGIEHFIHVRVNVLDTLVEFNAKLLK